MRNFLYNQAVNSPYLEHSHIKYCDSTYGSVSLSVSEASSLKPVDLR